MGDNQVPLVLQPLGKTVCAAEGSLVVEAIAAAGIDLDMPCGGDGTCGKCRVIVARRAEEAGAADRRVCSAEELAAGYRLACQTAVRAGMTIEIPRESLLASQCKILAETEGFDIFETDPATRKHWVELARPDRSDDTADLRRLERVLGPLQADLAVLGELPRRLREADFRGTAVVSEGRLLDFEPGDTRSVCCAVAVDLGTTTLAAMLVDMNTGRELAVTSRLNPQTRWGDDVLSRILYAQEAPDGAGQLQRAVAEAIHQMVGELAEQAHLDRRQIYEIVFSGNTTMQQLFLKLDARHLGEVPFVPVTSAAVSVAASELGIGIHPRGRAYLLPVIGGFVGGDTVAGILATGLADASGPTLLVDIGTNGEIVLAAGGMLRAASTAAGPAFEGARITHGMRGAVGAVERVVFDGHLQTQVIGGALPLGLCGSALVDLVAELLRHGLLTREGRLQGAGDLPAGIPEDLRARLVDHEGKRAFVLVRAEYSGTARPIVLTQRDVRELQLASGAMRAGIAVLLRRAGLRPEDLDAVLVAGGFGNYIRRANAQRIGLLPEGVPPNRIRYQGNTSLAGARLAAVSTRARRVAEELARRCEHVDLSSDAEFRWTFAEAMIFPGADGNAA